MGNMIRFTHTLAVYRLKMQVMEAVLVQGKRLLIGCLIFGFLLLLGGSAILISRVPSVSDQLPQNSSPVLVTILGPLSGKSYPVYAGLEIAAQALSVRPLRSLELWVDGELQETAQPVDPNSKYMSAAWLWQVMSLADHTLMVRGTDVDGRSGQSNIVHLTGSEPSGHLLMHQVQSGETIDSLASQFGITTAEILAANPEIPTDVPITPEQEIIISVPPPPLPAEAEPAHPPNPIEPVGQPPLLGANPVSLWLDKNNYWPGGPSILPAAPGLSLEQAGCDISLVISDAANNESGFLIYRLEPGEAVFNRLAALGSHAGTQPFRYTDENLSGIVQYYASSFNAAGETASQIVSININKAACPLAGDRSSADLIPDLPGGMDKLYLYFSANNAAWQRYPRDPNAFLDPQVPGFDLDKLLSSVLPPQAQEFILHGEVWGWRGGELVFIGEFRKTLPFATLEVLDINMGPAEKYYAAEKTVYELGKLSFRWSASLKADHGVWQVSIQPFPKSFSLTTPGVVLGPGQVSAQKFSYPSQTVYEGGFDIDFKQLATQNILGDLTLQAPPAGEPPFSLEQLLHEGQVTPNPSSELLFQDLSISGLFTSGSRDYFVRIQPTIGLQPVGEPSNTVVIHYDPSKKPPPVALPAPPEVPPPIIEYDLEIVDFQPWKAPTNNGCVNVTGWTPEFAAQEGVFAGLIKAGWPIGATVCPKLIEPKSDWEKFSGYVTGALDFFADLYNNLDKLVAFVLKELNPLCQAGGFVQKACEKISDMAAKVGVSAAKMYFGLPPSVPNTSDVMNLGKDYLANLAVEELENAGVPCQLDEEKCKDLVKKGIDVVIDQFQTAQANNHCAEPLAGYEPLCVPPGVLAKPDPGSQWQLPVLQLKATRRAGSDDPTLPQPTKCAFEIHSPAENTSWVGQSSYAGNYDLGTPQPLKGELFKKAGGPIPILAGGQSVTIPVLLQQISAGYLTYPHPATGWWLPGHSEEVEKEYAKYGSWPPTDDWYVFYWGAKVKLAATGQCKLTGFDEYYNSTWSPANLPPPGKTMQGQEKEYGPLSPP